MNAVYRPVIPAARGAAAVAPALDALSQPIGERIEILPDLFVEAAVAARIQGLVVSLAFAAAVWAAQAFTLAGSVAERPLVQLPEAAAPARAAAAPGLAERRAYLEEFNRQRKRALETFCYALAAAPAGVPVAAAQLAGERLTVTCACADSPAVRAYVKNLRAVVPAAHLAGAPRADADEVRIDTAEEAAP